MEKLTGSKPGKVYVKAVCCHPAYLTYMQSTSCELLGWVKHELESRLLGPQLEENHVGPTSLQDEPLARDGVSREVPCSALKGETVPEKQPQVFSGGHWEMKLVNL